MTDRMRESIPENIANKLAEAQPLPQDTWAYLQELERKTGFLTRFVQKFGKIDDS